MATTAIDWTDKVWNPTTGCTKGCSYCYARTMAHRLKRMGQAKYSAGFAPMTHPGELAKPLHWKKPCRVFIDSMGDLFDPAIPDDFIRCVISVIAITPHITYQILTKFPRRMQEFFSSVSHTECLAQLVASYPDTFAGGKKAVIAIFDRIGPGFPWPLNNLWAGVTIENQSTFNRWWDLYYTNVAHRFISFEPLTGPISFDCIHCHGKGRYNDNFQTKCPACKGTGKTLDRLEWVICGGGTGSHARPMYVPWVRYLRDECSVNRIPFFFKQWGAWAPGRMEISEKDYKHFYEFDPTSNGLLRKTAVSVPAVIDRKEYRQFPKVTP